MSQTIMYNSTRVIIVLYYTIINSQDVQNDCEPKPIPMGGPHSAFSFSNRKEGCRLNKSKSIHFQQHSLVFTSSSEHKQHLTAEIVFSLSRGFTCRQLQVIPQHEGSTNRKRGEKNNPICYRSYVD